MIPGATPRTLVAPDRRHVARAATAILLEGRGGGLLEPPGSFEYRQSATSPLRRRRTTERMPASSLVAPTYPPLGRSTTSRRSLAASMPA
ncbi:MAG: hypothetical protein AVDCRST_MAG12-2996 [uncultured Rubrobacteraceae bacterium]|uniref:Uncharacterized protein n=1 Tax=uncultured Rubrobacteraceae bacterium TaxID=349277 RepID=A0A6J4SVW7_9ACTN|nr:MAG: hypothetical protein AVDCRST_MAG12-2996 [uncultured Rubrobacteraceae bacterium]